MTRCVNCKQIETINGYTINREGDRKIDDFTLEPTGRTFVFYTVNEDDLMLDSFKTLAAARKYAKEYCPT